MPASTRPRISDEFLKRNLRERIIVGTARVIAEKGYRAASVTDIVKSCRAARGSFYNCFGGKEDSALAMVAALGIEIEQISESPSIDSLLIEVAAMWLAGNPYRASGHLIEAEQTIRHFGDTELAPRPPSRDPREGRLPPGRHGLPAEFVLENQRTRLLSGAAAAIVERGWPGLRIFDVTRHAALSRRTFYEHYGDLEALARALIYDELRSELPAEVDARSGLFAVAIEILSERVCDGDPSPTAAKALGAVYSLTTALEAL